MSELRLLLLLPVVTEVTALCSYLYVQLAEIYQNMVLEETSLPISICLWPLSTEYFVALLRSDFYS